MLSGPRNLVVALLLGAVVGGTTAGVVVTQREHAYREAREYPLEAPSPRLQAAIDEVREDGVHVTDDARHLVDAQAERAIEAAAAGSGGDHAVYTIVWTPTRHAGDGRLLQEKLERAFAGEQALLHVWEGPQQGLVLELGGRARGERVARGGRDFVGDPATVLPRMVAAARQAAWDEPYRSDGNDYWGGPLGGAAAGLLFAAPAIALLLLMIGLVRRVAGRSWRLPGTWGWL